MLVEVTATNSLRVSRPVTTPFVHRTDRRSSSPPESFAEGGSLLGAMGWGCDDGFCRMGGESLAVLASDCSLSGALGASFLRTGQAAHISTSARFMFIAMATNCR
jgi:hypothetical protein